MKSTFFILIGALIGYLLPKTIFAHQDREDAHVRYLQHEAKEKRHQKTFDSLLSIRDKLVKLPGWQTLNTDGSETVEYVKLKQKVDRIYTQMDSVAKGGL